MKTSQDQDPNRFAQQLFSTLPTRYDRLAELLSFGQNGRWRTRDGRPRRRRPARPDARRGLGHGRGGPAAGRPFGGAGRRCRPHPGHARGRAAERGPAGRWPGGSSCVPAGPSSCPSPTPPSTPSPSPTSCATWTTPWPPWPSWPGWCSPGGAVASLEFLEPDNPFWWQRLVALHPGGAAGGGARHRGPGVVRGRALPRPQHPDHYRRYPVAWTVEAVAGGRLRRRRRPADEPGRRPGHVGTAGRWVKLRRGRRGGPAHRRSPPSTPRGPGGWRRLVDAAAPAVHGVAPGLRRHRRLSGPDRRRHLPGGHPAGLLPGRGARGPRPRRAPRPTPAHGHPLGGPRGRGRGRARRRLALGIAGVVEVGLAARARSWWSDPCWWSPTTSSWLGGIVHNDVGFAAAWGAFPVLTAYVAQTGRLSWPRSSPPWPPSACRWPSGPSARRPGCCAGAPRWSRGR